MNERATAWMDGWLNAQQQYWKAWADLAGASAPAGKSPAAPWADALDRWWQAVSPLAPAPGRDLYAKLIDIGKGYFTLAERMTDGALGTDGDRLNLLNAWIDWVQKALTDWTQGMGDNRDPQLKSFMTFWDLPLDTWQRLAANLVPMPGDFTQAFHPEGATQSLEQFRSQVSRFLSIPAVGYTREAQEQYQHLARLVMDYNAALQAYKLAFGKTAIASLQDYRQSLEARAREEKPLSSVREIYDHWVDVCEKAYARFAMSEEYQRLYGQLVNKLMSLKQHLARMVDQGLEAMNMPTRAEINTLQRRQQEIRRDNQRLRNELRALRKQFDAARPGGTTQTAETLPSPSTKPRPLSVDDPPSAPPARSKARAKRLEAAQSARKSRKTTGGT